MPMERLAATFLFAPFFIAGFLALLVLSNQALEWLCKRVKRWWQS